MFKCGLLIAVKSIKVQYQIYFERVFKKSNYFLFNELGYEAQKTV